jgi:putative ABC transport system permease protein
MSRLSGLVDSIGRDIRHATRGVRRAPGFTVVAVGMLALAIGANTGIFSVVDQLLIRPLAYRDADRLVAIDATREYEGTPRPGRVFWQLDAAGRWQEALRAFSSRQRPRRRDSARA